MWPPSNPSPHTGKWTSPYELWPFPEPVQRKCSQNEASGLQSNSITLGSPPPKHASVEGREVQTTEGNVRSRTEVKLPHQKLKQITFFLLALTSYFFSLFMNKRNITKWTIKVVILSFRISQLTLWVAYNMSLKDTKKMLMLVIHERKACTPPMTVTLVPWVTKLFLPPIWSCIRVYYITVHWYLKINLQFNTICFSPFSL